MSLTLLCRGRPPVSDFEACAAALWSVRLRPAPFSLCSCFVFCMYRPPCQNVHPLLRTFTLSSGCSPSHCDVHPLTVMFTISPRCSPSHRDVHHLTVMYTLSQRHSPFHQDIHHLAETFTISPTHETFTNSRDIHPLTEMLIFWPPCPSVIGRQRALNQDFSSLCP